EVGRGNRAYVVAPRISANTAEEGADLIDDDAAAAGASGPGQDASGRGRSGQPQMSNVTDAAAMLAEQEVLMGITQGMLHGRMPAEEKDAVMGAFADGSAPLLVTTTVVEVGVDVPEATVMVILDA